MIFTSWTFVLFILVLSLFLFLFKSTKNRLLILLIASYMFYGAWNITYLLLIFTSSFWGWGLGVLMAKEAHQYKKKIYFILSLSLSLGMLAFYKYADFFVDNIYLTLGIEREVSFEILLPVGISFFTFQTMSYTIDLYRGKIPPCYSLKKFLLFVSFFPQLVAGPIVRAADFLPQLEKKLLFKKEDVVIGAQLFLGGAIQKVLIADNLSIYVDPVFANPGLYSSPTLWLGLVSYSVQIFCDFSGYSLMAIGIARGLSYKLPQNFNMPYAAQSISDFWGRWHMSLSIWLRDYLYISLGGNRKGNFRTYVNLLATMVLGGLWHGASWNFVVWGCGHGLALVIHKLWADKTVKLTFKKTFGYKIVAWALTFIVVILLWIPFRTVEFSDSVIFFTRLWGTDGEGFDWFYVKSVMILSVVILWHIGFLMSWKWLSRFPHQKPYGWLVIGSIVSSLMLFLLLSPQGAAPFIYFQF